jgi:electron transfer flavoprotein beta subunit
VNVVALVKYSLDVAEIRVDPATRELGTAGVPRRVGSIDKNVVEAAVRLKAAAGGTVQAICLGPAAARDGFKEVLAMGVDEVTLIEDPFEGRADAAVAVRILEAAIRARAPFDLILCGFASDDGYTHQVGPRLAERLGLPLISYAREVVVVDGVLQADRDLEDRLQRVVASLPVVVSIAEEAYLPRRTTLMDALKARQKPINVWQVEDHLGLSIADLEAAPSWTLDSLVGLVVDRKRQRLMGRDPAELADQLIDALLAERVLRGEA